MLWWLVFWLIHSQFCATLRELKISPCSRNIYTMADVIWCGEWLLKREHNIITMSLDSLLDYLLLHCHHKTCEVHYFCLSDFFHTYRQTASVTPPCESLAFILNELSSWKEGKIKASGLHGADEQGVH